PPQQGPHSSYARVTSMTGWMLLLLAMLAPIGVQAQTPEAAVVEAVAQDAHASFASTLASLPLTARRSAQAPRSWA
uniref:hypothetical protein n=1 Tax=Myxococcus vastator TaxID=2709664 RepID=UPI0019672B00